MAKTGKAQYVHVYTIRVIPNSIEIKSAGQKLNWPESPAIQQLGDLISETRRNEPRNKSKRAARPFTVRSLMLWVLLLGTLFGTCLRLRNDLENGLALFDQQLVDQQKMITTALEAKQSSGENWPRIKADYIRGIRNQDDLIDQTKNQLIIWLVAAMFLAVMAYFLTPVLIFVWLKSPKRHDDPKQVEEAQTLINPTDLK